jgi:hypothetical protein
VLLVLLHPLTFKPLVGLRDKLLDRGL